MYWNTSWIINVWSTKKLESQLKILSVWETTRLSAFLAHIGVHCWRHSSIFMDIVIVGLSQNDYTLSQKSSTKGINFDQHQLWLTIKIAPVTEYPAQNLDNAVLSEHILNSVQAAAYEINWWYVCESFYSVPSIQTFFTFQTFQFSCTYIDLKIV